MTQTHSVDSDGYFRLAAWCTVSKDWFELDERFTSVAEAQTAATKARGIYRISYVRAGRRLDLQPFGFIGDDF